MAITGYCGGECGFLTKCNKCRLDQAIPCSPNCENLTEDGNIKVSECLRSGCEEVKYIFDVLHKTDAQIIEEYGATAPYPYTLPQ